MLEEQLKNEIAVEYFKKFVCTDIIKRIDFSVKCRDAARHVPTNESEYLFWAEAKQQPTDIYRMLAQLLITIKADAWDKTPPKFLGCFDNEKICFVPYYNVQPVFALNDFNWTQTPSNVDDKTVQSVKDTLDKNNIFTFFFAKDDENIRNFIAQNFNEHFECNYLATLIDKNNFIFVYQKWCKAVMPYINAPWDKLKKDYSVYDRDFFLAELNIDDNGTTDISDDKPVNEDFYITFSSSDKKPYQLLRKDGLGLDTKYEFGFKGDGLERYAEFWKLYKRPPKDEIWKYIISRLDLLVPQDVRERKGAFFTPQIWVEKSQQYIADVLGADWQDEYYVWDCCAGTGNLLNGLTNKYHIFASTLDQQDVDVMKERIKNGANLLESHVFQFDFLNDDFLPNDDQCRDAARHVPTGKLPTDLYKIITDPEKRKKLVIYINPPYAEAGDAKQLSGSGKNKTDVAVTHKTYAKYLDKIGIAGRELFAQFFIRIFSEIPNCILAEFSTLKNLQGPNFKDFRNVFNADLKSIFLVPSNTFDNVKGSFPISFQIWNCANPKTFQGIDADVFNKDGSYFNKKYIFAYYGKTLTDWMVETRALGGNIELCFMSNRENDFQGNNYNFFVNSKKQLPSPRGTILTEANLIYGCIFLSVKQTSEVSWLNNRDQYLYPNDKWKTDNEFQTNCLIFALFHSQNKISCKQGINHWIPFSEMEVEARGLFDSHFMKDFLDGKIKPTTKNDGDLFSDATPVGTWRAASLQFTETAQSVLSAGRELWRYYHTMEDANPNASLYDIKEYFQGRNENGKMNASSTDPVYTSLLNKLKDSLRLLGEEIKPKVYEYGFLK